MSTTTYHADGQRPIRKSDDAFGIQNVADAARVFADRLARRTFGRKGYARTIRPDSWTQDGRNYTFEAFIGVDREHGRETVGRNVWLYVSVRGEDATE